MADLMDKVRNSRGVLDEIGMHIPGFRGYLQKELRRDADRAQRDFLAQELKRGKEAVEGTKKDRATAGDLSELTHLENLTDKLSRLITRVISADSGYSGFFATTAVTDTELAAVYQLDLALIEQAKAITAAATPLSGLSDSEYKTAFKAVEDAMTQFDTQFDQRKQILKGAI